MSKLVFKTKAEATQFLQEQEYLHEHSNGFSPRGTYYLAHGEYSQPDFKPVRYKDGWGIKKNSLLLRWYILCPERWPLRCVGWRISFRILLVKESRLLAAFLKGKS